MVPYTEHASSASRSTIVRRFMESCAARAGTGFGRVLATRRPLHYNLANPHVLEAIIDADDKRVFLGANAAAAGDALTCGRINPAVRLARTYRRNGHVEIVILDFVVRDLAHRLDDLPIARIQRILGPADGREPIHRAERYA